MASKFVISCEDGHIDEFPYKWWVHSKSKKECENPRLKIGTTYKSGGIDGIIVECESCGSKRSMGASMSRKALEPLKCSGKKIWLGEKENKKCSCGKSVRTLLRGSNNIYYPECKSALTIPPWSTYIQGFFDKHYELTDIINMSAFSEEDKKRLLNGIFESKYKAELKDCAFEEFYAQFCARISEENTKKTFEDIIYDEYKALTGMDKDDYYFKITDEEVPKILKKYISKISLIKRLREVKVLTGFRRIDAIKGEIACISNKNEEWLPAVELLGEGIFVEFDRQMIKKWKNDKKKYYEKLEKN